MTAIELFHEAARRGLKLEPRGDKLAVSPAGLCPPDFAAVLRAHKPALLAFLAAGAANLPPDPRPWLHVGAQILAGEFDGADRSTRESLTIGLRSIKHPLCQSALARLSALKP